MYFNTTAHWVWAKIPKKSLNYCECSKIQVNKINDYNPTKYLIEAYLFSLKIGQFCTI